MSRFWDGLLNIFHVLNIFLVGYLLIVCIFYLIIYFIAFKKIKKERGLHKIEPYRNIKASAFTPPLSIIVPAYNEELGIIDTTLSLVTGNGRLDYPEFEVIVVNDGSKDATLNRMIDRFRMMPLKNKVVQRRNGIATKDIKGIYYSELYPQLILIDKLNGGKADALNAGINLAKYPYFASIDGDTILEPDSFLKIIKPIVENNEHEVLAAGGNVLIANGSKVSKGQMLQHSLSEKPLVIMQAIEYIRAFLMGRIGLSKENLLLIVSGAFGVFNTARVIQAGGYAVDTVGEDMELVVRLHRMNLENNWKAKIIFVADPVCYTEVPEDWQSLRNQRIRWHRGLFESLWAHKKMIGNPKYREIGLVAMPYFLLVELLGPVIELTGYILVIISLILGNEYLINVLPLIVLMILYGSLLSMGAVLLEEWRLGKHQTFSELNKMFAFAVSETFWYRPILNYWRLVAIISIIRGKGKSWGEIRRRGISTSQ